MSMENIELKQFTCEWCKQDLWYKSGRSFGAHKTGCKFNPKHAETKAKISEKNTKGVEKISTHCEKCNTIIEFKRIIGSAYVKRFCSRACANARVLSTETKQKISTTATGKRFTPATKRKSCKVCSKEFELLWEHSRSTCSEECYSIYLGSKLKGKTGGYRVDGNKWRGSWYNDVWMDSSWELLFAMRLDELGITWKRDYSMCFEYQDKVGVTKKYHPDFYIPSIDKYVEVKGYWTDEARYKVEQVSKQVDILIFDSLEVIKTFTNLE